MTPEPSLFERFVVLRELGKAFQGPGRRALGTVDRVVWLGYSLWAGFLLRWDTRTAAAAVVLIFVSQLIVRSRRATESLQEELQADEFGLTRLSSNDLSKLLELLVRYPMASTALSEGNGAFRTAIISAYIKRTISAGTRPSVFEYINDRVPTTLVQVLTTIALASLGQTIVAWKLWIIVTIAVAIFIFGVVPFMPQTLRTVQRLSDDLSGMGNEAGS